MMTMHMNWEFMAKEPEQFFGRPEKIMNSRVLPLKLKVKILKMWRDNIRQYKMKKYCNPV